MKSILISFAVSTITLLALAVFAATMIGAVGLDKSSALAIPVSIAPRANAESVAGPKTAERTISETKSVASKSAVSKDVADATMAAPKGQLLYYPVRLYIPSIGVDALVQNVGITASGNLGTPDNFTDVAWYDDGTVPGNVGSAIIDGHVDNGLGLAGVFKNLNKIKIGDPVYVIDENGKKLDFTVTSSAYYGYNDVPVNMLFNESDGRILRLITCGGTWVPAGKTYDERLVVTATLASSG